MNIRTVGNQFIDIDLIAMGFLAVVAEYDECYIDALQLGLIPDPIKRNMDSVLSLIAHERGESEEWVRAVSVEVSEALCRKARTMP